MKKMQNQTRTFLGIEGGGTRSSGILVDENGILLKRFEGGSCNLRLSKDEDILRLWKQWNKELSESLAVIPRGVGIYLAGCRTHSDKARIRRLAKKVWPESKI